MTRRERPSRRQFLRTASQVSVVAVLAAAAASCGESAAVCSAPDKLTDEEIAMRNSLHYVEASDDEQRVCKRCTFFESAASGPCGTCKLLRGPVNPHGHCNSWSEARASS